MICQSAFMCGDQVYSKQNDRSEHSSSHREKVETSPQASEEVSKAFVWPISGTHTPDLPHSSAYGPRLKASEGFRYDYHQGIDIPTPLSTTLVAVSTGTVRVAGAHPLYSDGVVQIDHGDGLYSNYLHVSASLVVTGQEVAMGEPVARSGASESGFPHLHFEIREGSVWRKDTVNPLRYLPYTDTVRHSIAITQVLPSRAVWLRVTGPADELDINQVTVTMRSLATQRVLDSRTLDYEARNRRYDGDPVLLDEPDLDSVLIQPHAFNSASEHYVVDFKVHDLRAEGAVQITACAVDINANQVCVEETGTFDFGAYLTLIRR